MKCCSKWEFSMSLLSSEWEVLSTPQRYGHWYSFVGTTFFCKGTPTKKTIWIRKHEAWHRDKSPKNRNIQIQDLEDLEEYRCVDQLLWPGRLNYMDDFMDEIHHTVTFPECRFIYLHFMSYIMIYLHVDTLLCIYWIVYIYICVCKYTHLLVS